MSYLPRCNIQREVILSCTIGKFHSVDYKMSGVKFATFETLLYAKLSGKRAHKAAKSKSCDESRL